MDVRVNERRFHLACSKITKSNAPSSQAEVGTPTQEAPNQGWIVFGAEFSPVASPAFRGRGGNELSGELTAVLERAFFTGHGTSCEWDAGFLRR